VAVATVGTFGPVLVDSKGRSLYLFTKDSGGTSACTGTCATNWPAAVVTGTPTAGAGLDASKLTTLKRDDGSTQLVYNGHPLYSFVGDAAAGQAGGQGSGGIWFLVNAAGDQVAGTPVPGY
jgi:predicted lipoprotein with Yx(FWY)xxD motif